MLKFLVFSLMLEGGWQPGDYTLILNDPPQYAEYGIDRSWYLSLAPRVDWGPVYFLGSMVTETCFQNPEISIWGQPYQTTYEVETGLKIKNLTFGASHMCSHSTFITPKLFGNGHMSMDDSHTRVFARVELSTEAIQEKR